MALSQTSTTALSLLALGFSAAALAQVPTENPLLLSPYNVTLGVADVAKEAAWYEEVLGFHESMHAHPPNEEVEAMETPNFRFDLVWQKGSSRPPPALYQQGYLHSTFKSDGIDEDYKWLSEHGIKLASVRNPKSNALMKVTIHDPEGNEIEIKPAGQEIGKSSSDSETSVPAVAEVPSDNPLRNLRPTEVTFIVSDLSVEAGWYAKVLGFHQTMHAEHLPSDEVTALDIPGYRVFLVWHNGSNARPQVSNPQGCIHIAFRTAAFDKGYEFLMAQGIKVDLMGDPKSHVNRRMRIHDPDGNEIEIAASPSVEGQGH